MSYKHMKQVPITIDHNVVMIDKPLTDDILELNRKGYKTLFCCAGHLRHFYKVKGVKKKKPYTSLFYVSMILPKNTNINNIIKNKPKIFDYEIFNRTDFEMYIRPKNNKKIRAYILTDDVVLLVRVHTKHIISQDYKMKTKVLKKLNLIARDEFHKLVEKM